VEGALPFVMVAQTLTVPVFVVESIPLEMVAPVSPASTTLQVMVWLTAFAGSTVPARACGTPTYAKEGTPEMPVTGTKSLLVAYAVYVPNNRASNANSMAKQRAEIRFRILIVPLHM